MILLKLMLTIYFRIKVLTIIIYIYSIYMKNVAKVSKNSTRGSLAYLAQSHELKKCNHCWNIFSND
jgi:hypothetical protein